MTDDQPNERDLFGNDPEPLTATEWLIIVACLAGVLGILGGLIYLCLLLIRG